jgi:hypothetical protein
MKQQRKTITSQAQQRSRKAAALHKIKRTRPHHILIPLLVLLILFTACSYALAFWYQQKHKNEPLVIGTTFVSGYAQYFDLNPQETMQAMIDDAGFRQFRLVSYWDKIEGTQGIYDFSDLDWQFQKVEAAHGKISLAIGLRQPRWPECHMPSWAAQMPMTQWEPKLKEFMQAVMERYRNSPALESYQLENEFFLDVFGKCPDFSRDRLIREFDFAKRVDRDHPIFIARSNNALGFPVGKPTPDEFGVSVYKRVWDKTITKRYFEYPLPPWFYSSLAGGGEILTGKNLIIHELQMEAWLPDTGKFAMNDLGSLDEQYKSMNAERLKDRFEYGKDTGVRTMYTWGAEWWYWHKVKANDPSMWNVAKDEIAKANAENAKR